MIELQRQPQRSDQVLAREVKPEQGTMVLLHPQSGHYFILDAVGGRVWSLCDGTHSVSEIVSILTTEYDAPAEIIEADVIELLTDLAHERLVVGSA